MNIEDARWMEISLIDGRSFKLKFPVQSTEEAMAQRLEEALKLPTVSVSVDGHLYVIPVNSIKLITISPAPKKLPRTVIQGAVLV